MVTKTGYWIQVVDGQVKEVWDTTPPSNQEGWREAVEIFPDLVDDREMFTTHSFDLDATPAEIVWAKRELTVSERKDSLIAIASADFEVVVRRELAKEIDNYPTTQYDASAVATAQATYESRVDAVNAATTHENVDALKE